MISLRIKPTRNESPPQHMSASNTHQARVLDFLVHEQKRSSDRQAGACPFQSQLFPFLPSQAIQAFSGARIRANFCPVLQLRVSKIISEFFTHKYHHMYNQKCHSTASTFGATLQFPQCVKSAVSNFQNLIFQNSLKYRFYMTVVSQNVNWRLAGGSRFKITDILNYY